MKAKVNLIITLVAAILAALAAFGIIYFIITTAPHSKTSKTVKKPVEVKEKIDYKKAVSYAISDMDPINLKSSDTSSKSIVKVKVALLLADKSFADELEQREPEIQDIIISTFWNKTGDQLENGKAESVKAELLQKIKGLFDDPKDASKVLKVVFDSFILQ